MLKNYLKIAWRNLWQHKLFSLINISGLVTGLVSVMLILVYVRYELSYDRYLGNSDRIYRLMMVNQQFKGDDRGQRIAIHPGLGQALENEFPEVLESVQLSRTRAQWELNGKPVNLPTLGASATFFEVFDYKLLKGSKAALKEPNTVVVTASIAERLFGETDPLGKTLTRYKGGPGGNELYRVTGVMQDIPPNTHFDAEIISSLEGDSSRKQAFDARMGYISTIQYILLNNQNDIDRFRNKLPAFYTKYQFNETESIGFQPLGAIHLHSDLNYELAPNGDIRYIYIFSIAALLILLIACINFVNLSTAKSLRRAKEVGLRKVMGARRKGLVLQFLGEALILFVFSLLSAILIARLLLPFFAETLNFSPALKDFLNIRSIALFAGITLLAGTIAGLYPALFLSRQQAASALKGISKLPGVNIQFRKLLVIAQFAASVALIAGTMVVYLQLQFISNKRLGFDKELLVQLPFHQYDGKAGSFKNELLAYSGISNVSVSGWEPGLNIGGSSSWTDESDSTKTIGFDHLYADFDFFETLKLELDTGRIFSRRFDADVADIFATFDKTDDWSVLELEPIILNETGVKRLGLNDPVGKRISYPAMRGTVIGVVKDFNALTLHEAVSPMLLRVNTGKSNGNTFIRLQPGKVAASLKHIQKTWEKFFPEKIFEFSFVDDALDELYTAEKRMSKLFLSFTLLGIGISCLGVLALALFEAQQRSKEIGIRKVLGASVTSIIILLSKDLVKLVGIAALIAMPLAWYAMNRWLEDFAYRVHIEWWMFIPVGLLAILIALFTVSFQSAKAALMNPVQALRSE